MITSQYFTIGLRFVLLLLVQVLVFNHLNLFGYVNPMVYIMFLYWFPAKENRAAFLGLSFLLGLCIDTLSDTMAIHAAATVTIAYIRPGIMRFVFGVNYEFQSFKLSHSTKAQQFTFLALLILVHHLIFFSLEILSWANVWVILKKTLLVGASSLVLCLLFSSLFSIRKQ